MTGHNEVRGVQLRLVQLGKFDQFGIDYCCAGKQTLTAACQQGGIAFDTVVARLVENDAEIKFDSQSENWLGASLTALSNHIEQTHHTYLKLELPRLQMLADKVAKVHGLRQPNLLKLQTVVSAMSQEILEHTAKEETFLFPLLRKLEANIGTKSQWPEGLENAVIGLDSEHQQAGAALMELRHLTNEYTAPESACASWRALLAGLEKFDKDLRIHIHKENSILFPLAIKEGRP